MGLIHSSNLHGDLHGRWLALMTPSTPADPLGAGNTAFITALGVTPKFFYDVRKNLSVSGSNFSSLLDIKGDGTYGPSVGFVGTAPTWDGTYIQTTSAGSLVSSGAVSGIDLTAPFTCVFIGKITSTNGTDPFSFGAAATHFLNVLSLTGNLLRASSDPAGAGPQLATGYVTGQTLIVFASMTGNGTGSSIEVPNIAKVTTGNPTSVEPSTSCLLGIGGRSDGLARCAVSFRAAFGFLGNYTSGQKSSIITYAQTEHFAQTQ